MPRGKATKKKRSEEDDFDEDRDSDAEEDEYKPIRNTSGVRPVVSPPPTAQNPLILSPFKPDAKLFEQLKQLSQRQQLNQQKPSAPLQIPYFAESGALAEEEYRLKFNKSVPPFSRSNSNEPSKDLERMSGNLTTSDFKLMQELMEKCLQLYMTKDEVITALQNQARIDSEFTTIVWQKLLERNPDFFKAYDFRIRIKEQINAFNYLVSQQAQMMQKQGLLPQRPNIPKGHQANSAFYQTQFPGTVPSPSIPPPPPQAPSMSGFTVIGSVPAPPAPVVPQVVNLAPTKATTKTKGGGKAPSKKSPKVPSKASQKSAPAPAKQMMQPPAPKKPKTTPGPPPVMMQPPPLPTQTLMSNSMANPMMPRSVPTVHSLNLNMPTMQPQQLTLNPPISLANLGFANFGNPSQNYNSNSSDNSSMKQQEIDTNLFFNPS